MTKTSPSKIKAFVKAIEDLFDSDPPKGSVCVVRIGHKPSCPATPGRIPKYRGGVNHEALMEKIQAELALCDCDASLKAELTVIERDD